MQRIVQNRDIVRWVAWGMSIGILLAILFGMIGWYYGERTQINSGSSWGKMSAEIKNLQRENEELQLLIATVNTGDTVDRRELEDLKLTIHRLTADKVKLQRQNEFYRNILNPPNASKRVLVIRNFDLLPTPETGIYEYKFGLSSEGQPDRKLKGRIRFSLSGEQGGKPVVLPMPEFTQPSVQSLKYEFRYVKTVNGKIKLPDGFEPFIFIIEEIPRRKSKELAPKHLFNWMLAREV